MVRQQEIRMNIDDALESLSIECDRLHTENVELRGQLMVAHWEGHGPGAVDPAVFHRT
jgi:hypothetical protein